MHQVKNTTELQTCANLKLRQLTRVVTRHYDRYAGEKGLKSTQYTLLSHVIVLGPIRPCDLAKQMHMDASTLTRNMQSLVAHGWLKIGAGIDGRSRLVEATSAGRFRGAEGQCACREAERALNERLGAERFAALHDLLDACIECLDDEFKVAADDAAESTGKGGSSLLLG